MKERLNKSSDVKISINDIVIKAASLACKKIPETNSSWMGSVIRKYNNVDMSVAVQTDYGLVTPIVYSSNLKGLRDIANNMNDLAERAKNNHLHQNEITGGTFTIFNLGGYGVSNFSAIINPPQSCILAVGKTRKKVVSSNNKESPYK